MKHIGTIVLFDIHILRSHIKLPINPGLDSDPFINTIREVSDMFGNDTFEFWNTCNDNKLTIVL